MIPDSDYRRSHPRVWARATSGCALRPAPSAGFSWNPAGSCLSWRARYPGHVCVRRVPVDRRIMSLHPPSRGCVLRRSVTSRSGVTCDAGGECRQEPKSPTKQAMPDGRHEKSAGSWATTGMIALITVRSQSSGYPLSRFCSPSFKIICSTKTTEYIDCYCEFYGPKEVHSSWR